LLLCLTFRHYSLHSQLHILWWTHLVLMMFITPWTTDVFSIMLQHLWLVPFFVFIMLQRLWLVQEVEWHENITIVNNNNDIISASALSFVVLYLLNLPLQLFYINILYKKWVLIYKKWISWLMSFSIYERML